MKIILTLMLGLSTVAAIRNTVCDCSDPVTHVLKLSSDDCVVPKNPKGFQTSYELYSIVRGASKFRGYLCSRWLNVKKVTMNFWNQHFPSPRPRSARNQPNRLPADV